MYQCAEMQRMTRGRGIFLPIAAHASENWLRSRAFIGLPCPKKMAGIRSGMLTLHVVGTYSTLPGEEHSGRIRQHGGALHDGIDIDPLNSLVGAGAAWAVIHGWNTGVGE